MFQASRSITSALTALILGHATASGNEPVSLEVDPAYCFAPCVVTISVGVEPHKADRQLTVEADSLQFYRSSVFDLEGDQEPVQHTVIWKSLPEGFYQIRATLRRSDGDLRQASGKIRVIGP